MTLHSCNIAHWYAWAPQLETPEAWRQKELQLPQADDPAVPNVQFVPARLRRRLSRLSKMALHVAHHCISNAASDCVPKRSIFASRHGELHRTVRLLESIAAQETVSPTQFSLSVHNTAAGLHSIVCKDKSPMTAIAARHDTFLNAWIEALGWLHFAPDEPILVVMADEPLPTTYQSFTDELEYPYAIAYILTASCVPSPKNLIQGWVESSEPHVHNEQPVSQAYTFLRWFLHPTEDTLQLSTRQGAHWNWKKYAQTNELLLENCSDR